MNRSIILASFVFPERLETFLNYLQKRFKLDRERIFIYDNIDDPITKIVTYKVFLKDGKKIDLKSIFPRTIIIHKKGECLYTINALNKLIEEENGLESGNVQYRNYELDWEKYVKVDEKYLRPEELTDLKGDSTRLRKLGWEPKYTFESMMDEMIGYWWNKL